MIKITEEYLAELDMHKAYRDDKFEAARSNSHQFQEALSKVFVKDTNKISEFKIKYGVF